VTPELQRSEAAALTEIVDTLLAIGDTPDALAAAEQARKIFGDLLAGTSDNAERQRDLAVADDKVGNVQMAQGDLAGALKCYRDSLAIGDPLAQSDPGNSTWQNDLSASYEKVGMVAQLRKILLRTCSSAGFIF
jgi:tetratricopeptide (TPR) repeat protein